MRPVLVLREDQIVADPREPVSRRPLAELFRQLLRNRDGGSRPASVAAPAPPPAAPPQDDRIEALEARLTEIRAAIDREAQVLASIEARLAHLATRHSVDAAVERIGRLEAITARMPVSVGGRSTILLLLVAAGLATYLAA